MSDNLYGAYSKDSYDSYRQNRDSSGDNAAQSRSRSRSDMNSPGDQSMNDRPGGR